MRGSGATCARLRRRTSKRPRCNGELVDKDDVEHEPADGKEPVAHAIKSGRARVGRRHVIDAHRDRQAGRERDERRHMNADIKTRDEREEQQRGNGRDGGRRERYSQADRKFEARSSYIKCERYP